MMRDGVVSRLVDPTQRAPARLETRTPPGPSQATVPELFRAAGYGGSKGSKHKGSPGADPPPEIRRRSVKPVKDWLKRWLGLGIGHLNNGAANRVSLIETAAGTRQFP